MEDSFINIAPMIEWLRAHPGYAGLFAFIISTIESVPIIGTIIPGTVTMTALGGLVGAGIVPFWPIMFWSILGAVLGDNSGYWLGKHYKDSIPKLWLFRRHPQLLTSAQSFCAKHGGKSVFIGRFIGPVRALVPVVAGMMNLSTTKFMIANVTSAILWAPSYMFFGIMAGAISSSLPTSVTIILFSYLLGALLVVWLLAKFLRLSAKVFSRGMKKFIDVLHEKIKNQPRYYRLYLFFESPNTSYVPDLIFLMLMGGLTILGLLFQVLNDPSIGGDHQLDLMLWNLFGSFRTAGLDKLLAFVSVITEVKVLLLIWFVMIGMLLYKRYLRTAFFWLYLLIATVLFVQILRLVVVSPHPATQELASQLSSYPSLHMAIITAFVGFWSVLVASEINESYRRLVYWGAVFLMSIVFVTELYFGNAWFSDMLGGFLVGTIGFIFTSFFYLRKRIPSINWLNLFIPPLLMWCLAGGSFLYLNYRDALLNYQLVWKTTDISAVAWWKQEAQPLILYRVNRLGKPVEVINIQSTVSLNVLQENLARQDWTLYSHDDLMTSVKLMFGTENSYLTLIEELYHQRKPMLVMSKKIDDQSILVLKLWDSDTQIGATTRLWVGTLNYYRLKKNKFLPINYYNQDNSQLKETISSTAEFSKYVSHFETKKVAIPPEAIQALLNPKEASHRSILLLREKPENALAAIARGIVL